MFSYLKRSWDKLFPSEIPQVPRDEIDLLIDEWVTADLQGIDRIFSSDMSTVLVSVRKTNIIEYRKYLELLCLHFEHELDLSVFVTDVKPVTIYLRDFFTNEKKCYIDIHEEVQNLRENIIRFLTFYSSARKQQDPSFSISRNMRIMSDYIAELRDLHKAINYEL